MNASHDKPKRNIWIVNEYDPWPDLYIVITFGDESTVISKLKTDYKIYYLLDVALKRASLLQIKYGVKQTRIFYPNQVSKIVNCAKGRVISHDKQKP
ncbi:MAG: hypothetical protein ACI8TA_001587 [Cyclobacteriaceae bacterium]|jgi:hypothetical protein